MRTEKIITFDLDFFKMSQQLSKEELKKMCELLHEISIYNHLFLFTNNSCDLAIEIMKEWKLSLGYLIVNSGACVYNISSQTKIEENFLSEEAAISILRFGFISNLSFIVHASEDSSFSYGINYLNSAKYRGMTYQYKVIVFKYKKLESWLDIRNMVQNYSIYSLELFFDEAVESLKKEKISSFLKILCDSGIEFNYFVSDFSIYFFSSSSFKLKSISNTLKIPEEVICKNLVYSSLTFPDWQIALKAFFWISDVSFSEIITKVTNDQQVIYIESSPKVWSDWWSENDYMWKENLNNFGWISKRIKQLDLSKTNLKESDFKNNCYELNLQTGVLSSKILNEKDKIKDWKRNISNEYKSLSIMLFLWPEQIENIAHNYKYSEIEPVEENSSVVKG